ncbi:MAG: family 78 glycoside hydrolase catalytic domain [Armatimonadota bacterium]|nr:glycoside hydrolase family 78 protein [bacterium]
MNWKAKWIWSGSDPSPINYYWCARKEFNLNKIPTNAQLHITADSRYSVWVNGSYVGYGPIRSFTQIWRFDTYDIASYLKPGANCLSILVQHYGISTFQYLQARGGLLAQIDCDDEAIVSTDKSWKCSEHPSYSRQQPRMACQQAWTEEFDARCEPVGWTLPVFDDTNWESAEKIGDADCEPWGELIARDIPFLTQEPIYPARISGIRCVQPPRQVWCMDLKPNLLPGDTTCNRVPVKGLAATVINCSEPMHLSITTVCNYFGTMRIDGIDYSTEQLSSGIDISQGEHLYLIKVSGEFHELSATFAFDYANGDLVMTSPRGDVDAYPFVVMGPFDECDTQSFDDAWNAKSRSELIQHAQANTQIPKRIYPVHVSALTSLAKGIDVQPVVTEPNAILAEDDNCMRVLPNGAGDTELLVDFGIEVSGFVEIALSAPEGTIIDFNGFEHMQDGDIQWTSGMNMNNTFRYVARQGVSGTCSRNGKRAIARTGWQQWRSVVRRGFRYATITVRIPENCSEAVEIRSIKCIQSVYPYSDKGQFECSDALLNKIWDISKRTIRLCSEDTFVDCPAYEQTFWVGDARNESLFAYTAFGDYQLARRCLKLAGESLQHSPIVESHVPSGWHNILPAWSMLWAIACNEHYLYTNNECFLRDIYPMIREQNINIYGQFINKDGLFEIDGWNMLDWAAMDTPDSGVVTHQNMWLVEVLRQSAAMADLLGEYCDVLLFSEWAEDLKSAINTHLWDNDNQAYIDSIHADGKRSNVFSQQTQTIAYLCDIVKEDLKDKFAQYVTEVPEHWAKVGSAFMMAFSIEALEKAGNRSKILNLIRKWWGLMIDSDATACWETFSSGIDQKWPTRSYCHAWSAAPAHALPSYILGVKPLEPGFNKFEVKPYLEDLDWARGEVPTPHGQIIVDLKRTTDNTIELRLSVPPCTVATIDGLEYAAGNHTIDVCDKDTMMSTM